MHIVTFEEQNEGNGPVGLVYLNVDFLPFEGFCDLQRFRLIGIMMDSRNGELSCLNDIFLMGDRVLGSERLRLSPSSFKASSPVKDQYEPAPCFFFFLLPLSVLFRVDMQSVKRVAYFPPSRNATFRYQAYARFSESTVWK